MANFESVKIVKIDFFYFTLVVNNVFGIKCYVWLLESFFIVLGRLYEVEQSKKKLLLTKIYYRLTIIQTFENSKLSVIRSKSLVP